MNFLEKLKNWFYSKKEEKPAEGTKSRKGEMRVLIEMPYNIAHPANLLQPLLMAISSRTFRPEWTNVTDIRLYSLYDRDDNTFVGSFYALKREDGFYGNLVGRSEIWFLEKDAFKYEETEDLIVPLGNRQALVCVYKREKASVTASCLIKTDEGTLRSGEILHDFEEGTSFGEAYAFYQKMMQD